MRPRPIRLLLIALLAMGLIAGCGGGGGDAADSSTDVNQLLDETFSGGKDIKSGRLDVALDASSEDAGALKVKVAGPFRTKGEGKVPEVDIDASFSGGGQSIEAGVTSTGDRGFVSLGGTDYEVSGPVWRQFTAAYEQAGSKNQGQSLASLGIDPRKWLTDAKNAGEARVGDTDTIKITGGVDVPKLLEDLNTALGKIRSLGGAGAGGLPDQLTDAQKQQAADAVKDLSVEIYTGAEDKILRRMVVAMTVAAESGQQPADIRFDLQLLDLNEDQDIQAPENAKPFAQLASKLGGLGLGGLGLGGGPGQGRGGATEENLQKYSDCVQDAGGDAGKIRKCADLLTP
jgi:hypothetical protein